MATVRILPAGVTLEVETGTALLDAVRKAGINLEAPCGGKGTCGKCLVRIVEGDVDHELSMMISDEAREQRYVRACSARIKTGPVVVEIPQSIDETFFSDDSESPEHALTPDRISAEPLTRDLAVTIPAPRPEDGLSDLDRFSRELSGVAGGGSIDIALPPLRTLAETLRKDSGRVTVTVCNDNAKVRIIRVRGGHDKGRRYGLAVDLGTTTVAVQLLDLADGRTLATRNGYNDQLACGLDVISRINYAQRKGGLMELQDRAAGTINRLADEVARSQSITGDEITAAVISGNTVMTHLLLGLNPEYIRLAPYTPTIYALTPLAARETGIDIHPDAPVRFSPCVGSYVGGDITAGLLCTPLYGDDAMSLFIDIGTNGELVVGNRDFLMTCACSAGPAFEGGGIDCGMRAAPGAIGRVGVDGKTGDPEIVTIGNVKPRGICGSGMIDLLAGLFKAGLLDRSGNFSRSGECSRIIIEGRHARYIIVPAGQSATGREIYVSETDIGNIMRAKAAIYSATALLLSRLGTEISDISRVYVAGGFGKFLDLEGAVTIGLLPDIGREKFEYLGNASLRGSAMALLSREHRELQSDLVSRMTYVDLSNEPGYMDQYTAALFLPHTDLRLFPSVKQFAH